MSRALSLAYRALVNTCLFVLQNKDASLEALLFGEQ
jgi:hypothetical protein